ncbi:hypothetical protein KIN20_018427 [Parelaphostrongylus tenuis]|uniref:MADF domain-containing protein n=1 Tax=Parelaphostrongylus tenuis TaxID=148309 RepID=A0AAD5QRF4_PARTN|nr:hypothetical protein KIN20_018427 [Parelaphostrongylus tenuis]
MMSSAAYRLTDDIAEPSFNMRLIEAVKHSRCLYDSTDRQYRSTEYKIKVWNRLVQVLQFEGDARTLYARWKQLRDKYGKEKRKVKYQGDQSTWQYFKHLAFLDPHMIDRTASRISGKKRASRCASNCDRSIVWNESHRRSSGASLSLRHSRP